MEFRVHFEAEVAKALAGSRKINIKFREDGFTGILRLLARDAVGEAALTGIGKRAMLWVYASSDWGRHKGRIVQVHLTHRFLAEPFIADMCDHLEAVEAVS
jgi:hypothetical protein